MRPPAAIMETAIYADDLDAAEAFYRDVFGLEVVRRLAGSSYSSNAAGRCC